MSKLKKQNKNFISVWKSCRQQKLQALPISSNHADLWNIARVVWLLTDISSSEMSETGNSSVGEMLTLAWPQASHLEENGSRKSFCSDRFHSQGINKAARGLAPLLGSIIVECLVLIALIFINSQLDAPMYYFIRTSSFVDLCNCSVITPNILMNFVSEKNVISFETACHSSTSCLYLSWLRVTCWPMTTTSSYLIKSAPYW